MITVEIRAYRTPNINKVHPNDEVLAVWQEKNRASFLETLRANKNWMTLKHWCYAEEVM